MILIFGGAYQGKLEYAKKRLNAQDLDVFSCKDDDVSLPEGKAIIDEIDKWILALLREDRDVQKEMMRLVDNDRNAIITCNDISCGVVPIEPIMRKWREEVGRALAFLAAESDEVVRLYCGLATRLK